MSIISGSAAISTAAGSSDFYDFPIGQSLMFDGSSYLQRTPTTITNSSQTTWTWSMWMKRSKLGIGNMRIFGAVGSTSVQTEINVSSNDRMFVYHDDTYNSYRYDERKLRDTSAWYHNVIVFDATQSDISNKIKIYLNGVLATNYTSSGTWTGTSSTGAVNTQNVHRIGAFSSSGFEFEGYMAEINFIDGTALTPSSFGETKNGVWTPKNPSGLTYGTNGFRLTFENDGTTNTISGNDFVDQSTNSNNWTAVGF